jgi:pimeloyl-ACP methyl ester carboxylesterase
MRNDFGGVVDGIAKRGTHAPDETLMARLRQMMLDVGADTAIRQTRAVMRRGDHREALAKLALPVRVLCGRQDRITPPDLSEELARLIPSAQLLWVQSCGHMLPFEQPQAVVDGLRPLLV